MVKNREKIQKKRPNENIDSNQSRIAFNKYNYLIFFAAILDIVFGFYLLSKESLTAAPIVLVFGFCVLLPLAPLWGIWDDNKLE